MTVEAASLAVCSGLHLAGAIHVADRSGAANGAGIVEALICVVLLVAAFTLSRWPGAGRRIGLPALGFAIAGFIVGLSFTARGGQPVDLTYHAVMLPVLILTALSLLRTNPASLQHER